MNSDYLSLAEAARRAGDTDFLQNVRREVLPRLIERGLLTGKEDEGRLLVANDAALARIERLGVERFVYGQQGYSLMAVRAPIADVSRTLGARPGVVRYAEHVTPLPMSEELGVEADAGVRHAFLVQLEAAPEWSVLIQTVHWFQSCDAVMVTALATALSADLRTLAAAAWDDDFSGSSLVVCRGGNRQAESSRDEDGWEEFYTFFYEQGMALPEAFIAVRQGQATFHTPSPAQILRADAVVLRVPPSLGHPAPHPLEKLGMMAEAITQDLPDEEAFLGHMRDGVWHSAQAVLAAGEL